MERSGTGGADFRELLRSFCLVPMATVPGQLIWEIVKKNNSLVKQFGWSQAGVRRSVSTRSLTTSTTSTPKSIPVWQTRRLLSIQAARKDQEAEQANQFGSQVCDEEGFSSHGQGCHQPGLFCNCVLPTGLNETKVWQVRSDGGIYGDKKKLRSHSSNCAPGSGSRSSRQRYCLPPSSSLIHSTSTPALTPVHLIWRPVIEF